MQDAYRTQVTAKALAGDRIDPITEHREGAAGPSEPVHGQLLYLQVSAVDVTQSAAFCNGGEVLDGPFPDGSERWLATVRDPGGNVLGIAQNRTQ